MHAIIKSGGKQYCVDPNDIIKVEKLELKKGSPLEISEVLMIKNGDKITSGSPFISGAVVKAEVLEQKRSKSITVFKKKRRHNYRRKHGHKQDETVIKVLDILVDETSIVSNSKKAKKPSDTSEKNKRKKEAKVKNTSSSKKDKEVKKANKEKTTKEE
ncbi:MAG: 50S ribosomal protein L21 [Rhodospirillaceae bacterium]|nr:50S ribosomal protein L21 [Rhodospirillaceae bacterium]